LEAIRKIGDSNFGLFGNSRVGLLFGNRKQVASSSTVLNEAVANGVAVNTTTVFLANGATSGFGILPIVEMEAGAQWTRCLGNFELVVRPAAVGQVYFDGGNATGRTGNFGLVGGMLTAGVRY